MMRLSVHCILLLLMMASPIRGLSTPVDERDMKAALLYHFSVYTNWPEYAGKSFNICTFAEDRENINPDMFDAKRLNEKSIRFLEIHSVNDMKSCQVLYLEESNNVSHQKTLEFAKQFSVLTVTNAGESQRDTGMINIQLQNKKYQFAINLEAAKQAGLTISSKLLRLATKVY